MNRAPGLDRLDRTIEAQRRFIRTVPDPDNRERAEANLMSLVILRDEFDEAESRDTYLPKLLIK